VFNNVGVVYTRVVKLNCYEQIAAVQGDESVDPLKVAT